MAWSNPIVGGTSLLRSAIQSPNYEAATSGWSINKDGTAEFNAIVIRDDLESSNFVTGVSGWQLKQDGSAEINDLVARGSLATGTVAPYVAISDDEAFSASGEIQFVTVASAELSPSIIRADQYDIGGDHVSFVFRAAELDIATIPPMIQLLSTENSTNILNLSLGSSSTAGLFQLTDQPQAKLAVGGTNNLAIVVEDDAVVRQPNLPLAYYLEEDSVNLSNGGHHRLTFDSMSGVETHPLVTFDDANDRFTPLLPGWWRITGLVRVNGVSSDMRVHAYMRKNGATVTTLQNDDTSERYTSSIPSPTRLVDGILDFNGVTDYIEFMCFQRSNGTRTTNFHSIILQYIKP